VTIRGEVRSEWRIEKGRFTLDVSIPPNTTAAVHIPGTDPAAVLEGGRPATEAENVTFLRSECGAVVFEIGSGRYSFASKPLTARGPCPPRKGSVK
jgi:alpha-L-rhamnosidase